MKFASVMLDGRATWGVCDDEGYRDIGPDSGYETLRDFIESGALNLSAVTVGPTPVPLDQVEFMPVIPNPRQIFCVGVNYEAHRRETGRDDTVFPTIFLRLPSSQVGHEQTMLKPGETEKLDYEGELAVIIGRGGRRIAATDAFDHIAGYSCYNDGSVRDWQNHTTQWTPGKNFVATGGFGPHLVTADEVPDIQRSSLTTLVNGEERQHAAIADMTTPIADVIAYLSTFTPLYPGDVIATGTPGGVGSRREPPTFLADGDEIEVHIEGVGVLRNRVVDDPPLAAGSYRGPSDRQDAITRVSSRH